MLNELKSCFVLLGKRDRIIWLSAVSLQILLSFFDLIGVLIVGVIGSLSIRGIQNTDNGDRINSFLGLLNIEKLSLQYQVAILGGIAIVFFVLKTIFSSIIQSKVIEFFCTRSAFVSTNLFNEFIESRGLDGAQEDTHKRIYALTTGVSSVMNGVLVQALNILADTSLFVVLLFGLFFIEPIIGFTTLLIFASTAVILGKLMVESAFRIGKEIASLQTRSSQIIEETSRLYREIFVSGTLQRQTDLFKQTRKNLGKLEAKQRFMPYIGKYVFEVVVILSLVLVSGFQFLTNSASSAAGNLSVFFAACVRLAPAILRIQQSFVSMKGNLGSAFPTLSLIAQTKAQYSTPLKRPQLKEFDAKSLEPGKSLAGHALEISGLYFRHPSSSHSFLISDLNLCLKKGEHLVVFGPSGSGKTSLVDLILSVREPSKGQVHIFGKKPSEIIEESKAVLSYVPQRIWLIEGTILDNLKFSFKDSVLIESKRVNLAMKIVGPIGVEAVSPNPLDYQVGSSGSKLSGGQIQRIGIARALVSNPDLLVLDEATNALDSKSQSNIYQKLLQIMGHTTLITITHNHELLSYADKILFLGKGNYQFFSSFKDFKLARVNRRVPKD